MSRKRRRPQALACSSSTAAAAASVITLVLSSLSSVRAASELSWSHAPSERPTAMAVDADGSVVLGGCASNRRAYVAKFSREGRALWRRESDASWFDDANRSRESDADPESDRETSSACVVALDTDDERFVYAVGSRVVSRRDADAFVVQLAPSDGAVGWRRALSTPFPDRARALRVTSEHLYVVGHSEGASFPEGSTTTAPSSSSNCRDPVAAAATMSASDGVERRAACDDGVVLQLARRSGELLWSHALRSDGADRVFDVAVASADVVVIVGDTTGDLTRRAGDGDGDGGGDDGRQRLPHSGDVFVAALTTRSGERLWLSQLEPARGAAPGTELCAQPDGRGRCSIAVDAATGAVVVTGSTTGWLARTEQSDDDDEEMMMTRQYRETCGAARTRTLVGGTCLQLFVARLALASGDVSWVHQLLDATHTTSDAVLLLRPSAEEKHKDVVVLGTADAGLVSAERMEQLVLRRLSGADAVVRWTRELGLAGEDHGVALAATSLESDSDSLLVAGVGSQTQSRGATTPLTTYVLRVDAATGRPRPLCVDHVAFVEPPTAPSPSQALSPSQPQPVDVAHELVELQLRRATPRCAGPLTVAYRLDGPAVRLLSALAATGSVVFRDDQETAELVLAVPSSLASSAVDAMALHVELQPSDVIAIDGDRSVTVLIGGPRDKGDTAPTPEPVARAADGRLWRELSSVFSLATALVLLLAVLIGRLCWRRCLRRAKVFQYKMIRLRRRRSSQQDADDAVAKALGMVPVRSSTLRPQQHQHQQHQRRAQQKQSLMHGEEDENEAEAEELRSHLEEIQELNDALEGLLSPSHSRRGGSSASTPSSSPHRKSSPSTPRRLSPARGLRPKALLRGGGGGGGGGGERGSTG